VQKIILSVFIFLITLSVSAKVPYQKIYFKGLLLPSTKPVIKVDELLNFKTTKISIFDPYTYNQKIDFTGVTVADLFKFFARPNADTLKVTAINNYIVTIDKKEASSEKMLLAFMENKKYIPVDRMGPARIVKDGKGKITKMEIAKEGIKWVWQVRTLEFYKK